MRILAAKNSGFCFGVRRAVNMAESLANSANPVYTYGNIIHNEQVVAELAAKNVHPVRTLDALAAGDTLIIRAHGAPPALYRACEEKGIRLVDATCPFVKRIHRIVEREAAENRYVLIAGEAEHPEVVGIRGWAGVRPQTDAEQRLYEEFKDYRERYKSLPMELKKLLPSDVPQAMSDLNAMRSPLRGLAGTLARFHERFMARKQELSEVDFNDLEHMTLRVLRNERLRELEQNRFDAVFVDEYQDVSELQEALLSALKREGGAPQYYFYVGDVKQSIYRFRLAEPRLFLGKQQSFSTREDARQRLIVLNRNFRSRSTVLSSVNRVFSHLMDSRVTEIDYDDSARLVAGSPSTGDPPTELHFIDEKGLKPAQRIVAEATAIAKDILSKVGQPVYDAQGNPSGVLHYRDIAILSPVSKNFADKVELTLRSFGIPVYCENASDSMESDELVQVVQHLKLLDNPMDDLSLISVLRSPLFEMSESELCRVRLVKPQKEASFLEALRAASEKAADEPLRERCAQALSLLERERFLLSAMPLDEYLWDFLQRSGLYAHYGAQPGGKLRQANLQMLCSLASDYEQSRGDGLAGFLNSLGGDLKIGSGLSPTVVNPWEDVVRLMTIHKSKGLEFPTVYVMGLSGSLRRRSQSGKLAYHAQLGVGLQYVNEAARTKRKTLLQSAIELARRNEEMAERARLLYVAMTRAKNRLCMLGSADLTGFGFQDMLAVQQNGYDGGVYAVKSAGSMLDWLAQCVRPWDHLEEKDFSTNPLRITDNQSWLSTLSTGFPQEESPWQVVFHIAPEIASLSRRDGGAELALPSLASLPASECRPVAVQLTPDEPDPIAPPLAFAHHPLKLGVTALCRMLADASPFDESEASDEPETPQTKRQPIVPALPKLLSALSEAPSFLLPAREERPLRRGTATHKLLCMLNLDGARAQAVERMPDFVRQSLAELTASGVMSPEEAQDADVSLVSRFLTGDMGARMLASDTVRREWRFNLRVHEPVETIAQGVIDLCFLEDGGWVLVDFKTDRVKDERELYERYARQLSYYRQALEKATRYPVKECALFSLTLGKAVHEALV